MSLFQWTICILRRIVTVENVRCVLTSLQRNYQHFSVPKRMNNSFQLRVMSCKYFNQVCMRGNREWKCEHFILWFCGNKESLTTRHFCFSLGCYLAIKLFSILWIFNVRDIISRYCGFSMLEIFGLCRLIQYFKKIISNPII